MPGSLACRNARGNRLAHLLGVGCAAEVGRAWAALDGFFDGADHGVVRLASCAFAEPPFSAAAGGAVKANPFPPARAYADGVPASFVAFDSEGLAVLSGSAGYREEDPAPEMKFRTRVIVKDADVLVESFVFAVIQEKAAA